MVHSQHAVVLMNTGGIVIRIPAAQIPAIGRATQGVTLMRMGHAEQVASMAIVELREDASGDGVESLNGNAES
jgi:DNA gyrase subunit A